MYLITGCHPSYFLKFSHSPYYLSKNLKNSVFRDTSEKEFPGCRYKYYDSKKSPTPTLHFTSTHNQPTKMNILVYTSIIILVYTSKFINLVSVSLMPTSDHLWVHWYIKSNSRPTRSITRNYNHNVKWHIPTWNCFLNLLASKPPIQPIYRSSIFSD